MYISQCENPWWGKIVHQSTAILFIIEKMNSPDRFAHVHVEGWLR
jgi:hypothetical protein